MINSEDILDLINRKCFKGLKSEYDVQLVFHVQLVSPKFHKNGKNKKKQSVWLFCLQTLT